ncbi:DNA glycosylase AlkZ-like family protein [Georgenia sp. Z1491]|uniref:DNA glycosylase AlkZ-like family protein n=1 Tax=Georgenia sp. Z1491 TaxID=3416707 RepID=UPI003CF84E47
MSRTVELDGRRALAWRLDRHGLGDAGASDPVDVVRRVVALRGWPAERAELSVGARSSVPAAGALEQTLGGDDLVLAYAFRGGSYVMEARTARTLLTVRRTTRVWETPRYQRQASFELDDWGDLRAAVGELLTAGPATREEIAAHLGRSPSLAHLARAAGGLGADALYKPLHWWGDIVFGPPRDGRSTFRLAPGRDPGRIEQATDEAGVAAVVLYLAAYAPATEANLLYWLGEGLSAPRRRVLDWLRSADAVRVGVDGRDAWALGADLEAILGARASDVVRLLPGHDPWVLGPGTADDRIVPPHHRAEVSRGSDLVVRGGVVVGTWRTRGSEVSVAWFGGADAATRRELESELARVGVVRGRELALADG